MAKKKAEAQPVVVAYKGFGLDWKCRDFQYEIGKSYAHKGEVKACNEGFHACEDPGHVLRYYRPNSSRFAIVEQSGDIDRHYEDSKIASRNIFVKAEITLTDLIKAAVTFRTNRCEPASGATSDKENTVVKAEGKNKSATASGYSGAATASGNSGAATASGYSGAATASGNYGAATASGNSGKARGKDGCALFLVFRDGNRKIVHAKAAIVGSDGIKADTFYSLDASGNFVEV